MPEQHTPGTPVKFQTGKTAAQVVHEGKVTGHKATKKGPFVLVQRNDGRDFAVRPARVSVS